LSKLLCIQNQQIFCQNNEQKSVWADALTDFLKQLWRKRCDFWTNLRYRTPPFARQTFFIFSFSILLLACQKRVAQAFFGIAASTAFHPARAPPTPTLFRQDV